MLPNKTYHLFVSPHLDDIIFSTGSILQKILDYNQHVIIATVFTKENNELLNNFNGDYYHYANYRERKIEDKKAMKKFNSTNLIIKYFDLDDEIFRNYTSVNYEDNSIINYIINNIEQICSEYNVNTIYSPLAIGYHKDHLITFSALQRLKNKYLIKYYYDYPYCNIKLNTIVRLSDFGIFESNLMLKNIIEYYNNPIYSSCNPLIRIIKIIILLLTYFKNILKKSKNYKLDSFIVDQNNKIDSMLCYKTQIKPIFGSTEYLYQTVKDFNMEKIIYFF
jgi:LmbE family N-acetylglucosaminyl deacetylase